MQRTGHFLDYPLSIAPMMEWTDKHYRFLLRLVTRKTILFTEMVTAEAILNGNREKLLSREDDSPVILQLGGNDPTKLAKAIELSKSYEYDGFNLNVGCPSDRVSDGSFGACLMAKPDLVSECILAMKEATNCPVSVKHRIGINGRESYEDLSNFVQIVHEKGCCDHFIVHARIAILGGLSPSENRTVPPLRYEDVIRLKNEYPHLRIEINGGIRDLRTASEFLQRGMDGVMIGRAAYETPMIFRYADTFLDGYNPSDSDAIQFCMSLAPDIEKYVSKVVDSGGKVNQVLRHTMGFLHGINGGRRFRQYLSDRMHKEPKNSRLYEEALNHACNLVYS